MGLVIQKMENKNIGIVTLWKANYGSSLQCYATKYLLKKRGYEGVLLVHEERNPLIRIYIGVVNRIFRSLTFLCYPKYRNSLRASIVSGKKQASSKNSSLESFNEEYLNPQRMDYLSLKRFASKETTVRVFSGSDQVWNGNCVDFYMPGFLSFVKKAKRVAWAASFGVGELPDFNKQRFAKKIKKFYKVSVREQRGREIVNEITGMDPQQIVDPVLMLSRQEWDELISKKLKESEEDKEDYIVAFFLDRPIETAIKIIERFSKKSGFNVVVCSQHHIINNEVPFKGDPFELIDLIRSAKFVISDSFHAIALAIEYGVNFWAVERKYSHPFNQSERLISILTKIDLNKRFIEKTINLI